MYITVDIVHIYPIILKMREGCRIGEVILPYREKSTSIQVDSFDFPNFCQVDRTMVGES